MHQCVLWNNFLGLYILSITVRYHKVIRHFDVWDMSNQNHVYCVSNILFINALFSI